MRNKMSRSQAANLRLEGGMPFVQLLYPQRNTFAENQTK
jgi:hypothetical protein